MDKDELIRFLERRMRIRTLHEFEQRESFSFMEREFAIEALDLMRRQPAMEALLEMDPWETDIVH